MNFRKLRLTVLIGLPVLAVLLVAGYYTALHMLKQQVTAALGQTGEVGAIRVSLSQVEIDDLRIKASRPGWPAADELRAKRVRVTPALRSLLSGSIVISSITVENAALSVLRSREGLKILPALLDAPGKTPRKKEATADKDSSLPKIRIDSVRLVDSRIDFFDTTLGGKRQHIPLDQLELSLDGLILPAMDEAAALTLQARVAAQGSLSLAGKLVPASMDSDLKLTLRQVPLKLVEPYLFKGKAGEIQRGTLALDLHSKVAKRQLNAPGHMVLNDLEIGGLTGLAREAAASWARSKGVAADTRRPVDMDFTLQGNLDDSRFSLNDTIYAQGGLAALKLIGIGGTGASGDKPDSGLGDAIRGLFGK